MKRHKIALITNLAIILLTVYAEYLMLSRRSGNGTLASAGLSSLKYFTVLSNLFAGAAAVIYLAALVRCLKNGAEISERLQVLKLAAATAVGLTFLTVLVFLGRLYGYKSMYVGANLWFHLVTPLIAMAEYFLLDSHRKLKLKSTLPAMIPVVLYGIFYIANVLANGVGEWSTRNDFYGFFSWGTAAAPLVFAVMLLVNWLIAAGLLVLGNGIRNTMRTEQR